jgi:hypothetical protein
MGTGVLLTPQTNKTKPPPPGGLSTGLCHYLPLYYHYGSAIDMDVATRSVTFRMTIRKSSQVH